MQQKRPRKTSPVRAKVQIFDGYGGS